MGTYNDDRVIMGFEDLRNLIKQEVKQFREEVGKLMDEVKRSQQLDAKPLSILQVAERYDVSKATIHNWMGQGIIKGFKQGKGRYFYLHELDESLTRYKYIERLENNGIIEKKKQPWD